MPLFVASKRSHNEQPGELSDALTIYDMLVGSLHRLRNHWRVLHDQVEDEFLHLVSFKITQLLLL